MDLVDRTDLHEPHTHSDRVHKSSPITSQSQGGIGKVGGSGGWDIIIYL